MTMFVLADLMAPLGPEHCRVYYILGLIMVCSFVIALGYGIFLSLDKKKRTVGVGVILNSLALLFSYYIHRITYSMCNKIL